MKERYRRYHETDETQAQKQNEMNGEAIEVLGEPVEEVVTKTEIKVDETTANECNNIESGKSSSISTTKKKKRKSVIKSNKVSPLIQADES